MGMDWISARPGGAWQGISVSSGGWNICHSSPNPSCLFFLRTLEHLPDFKAPLKIGRVLRPGGSLILSVPANQKYWSAWDDWAGHQRRFDPKRWRTI